jgi:two-component sensor histidine kinase/PAS domain-containing protein
VTAGSTQMVGLELEVAMALTASLDLDHTLRQVARVLTRRLTCAGIFIFEGESAPTVRLAQPRAASSSSQLAAARAACLDAPTDAAPASDADLHLIPRALPAFGYLVLARAGPLSPDAARLIDTLAPRIGHAAAACRAHAELTKQHARFARLTTDAPVALLQCSVSGAGDLQVHDAGPQVRTLLGPTFAGASGDAIAFWPHVAPSDQGPVRRALRAAGPADPIDLVFQRATDGDQLRLTLAPERAPDGRRAGALLRVGRPIRAAHERTVADSEVADTAQLDRVLHLTSAVVVVVRLDDLRVELVSGDLERLLGGDLPELRPGGALVRRMHPVDAAQMPSIIATLIRDERVRVEVRVRDATESYRWLRLDGVLARDDAGRPARAVAACFDITSDKRDAARLRLLSAVQAGSAQLSTAMLGSSSVERHDPTPALCRLGEALEASRVLVSQLEDGDLRVVHAWSAAEAAPIGDLGALGSAAPAEGIETLLSALRDGTPRLVDDVTTLPAACARFLRDRGVERLLMVPLRVEGVVRGCLSVANPTVPDVDHAAALPALQTMADAIGADWQRAATEADRRTLLEQRALTADRLERLLALSASLAQAPDHDALLDTLADSIFGVIGIAAATFTEAVGDDRYRLTTIGMVAPNPRLAGAPTLIARLEKSVETRDFAEASRDDLVGTAVSRAMAERRTISTLEYPVETFDDWRFLHETLPLRSFAVTPLLLSDRVMGTLNISHPDPDGLGPDLLAWFEQIGAFVAAQLAVRDAQARLEALNQDLESRVSARTAELAATRDQLAAALRTTDASLREKETLLKEVHHRVKNNLQIISSMLALQTDQTGDLAARRLLQASAERVRSMALIHQQLYGAQSLARIDLADYTRTLATELCSTLAPDARLTLNTEPVELAIDRAVPVGLVLNELVTNALKHGRDAAGRCAVRVDVAREADAISLTVADDGPGLPDGLRDAAPRTIGWTLVDALVGQVRGRLEVDSSAGAGTSLRVTVPLA